LVIPALGFRGEIDGIFFVMGAGAHEKRDPDEREEYAIVHLLLAANELRKRVVCSRWRTS
jgi:hypothetical protein